MAFSSSEDIISFVTNAIPGFMPTGEAQEFSGGNLNHVWRVIGKGQSFIVKQAPPYVAKAPEIPINPERILIEAATLRLFDNPPLNSFISDHIRPPRLIYSDTQRYAIILEDVGDLPTLDNSEKIEPEAGARLGNFLGKLHSATFENEEIAEAINNKDIQQSRLDVQYAQIEHLLADIGFNNSAKLGHKTKMLGEKYLTKGKCLIMGDLWPRSVLMDNQKNQIRLIDWEFAHFGRPAQDVAHLLAHLWMLQHQADSPARKMEFKRFHRAFVKGYRAGLGEKRPMLFDNEEIEDAGLHYGSEILARTIGSFQDGYLYEGFEPNNPQIGEAINEAIRYLKKPVKFMRLFRS